MDKDITSLPNLIVSKEVRAMLTSLDSKYSHMSDLSKIFSALYEEGRISEIEFKFYQTKFSCLKFSSQIERKFKNTTYAIYLFDDKENVCWNFSTASLPKEINKFTNGSSFEFTSKLTTLLKNEKVNYIEVSYLEKEHEIFVAEHQRNLLKYGYLSLFIGVLKQNGSTLGFTTLLFKDLKKLTQEEINLFQKYNGLVEHSLHDVNNQFIQILKNQI